MLAKVVVYNSRCGHLQIQFEAVDSVKDITDIRHFIAENLSPSAIVGTSFYAANSFLYQLCHVRYGEPLTPGPDVISTTVTSINELRQVFRSEMKRLEQMCVAPVPIPKKKPTSRRFVAQMPYHTCSTWTTQ